MVWNEYAIMHWALSAVNSFIFYLIARKWDPDGVDICILYSMRVCNVHCATTLAYTQFWSFISYTRAIHAIEIKRTKKKKRKNMNHRMNVRKVSTKNTSAKWLNSFWKRIHYYVGKWWSCWTTMINWQIFSSSICSMGSILVKYIQFNSFVSV